MANLLYLKNSYEKRRLEIKKRLEDFKKVWEKSDGNIFAELCFCLLTPMSRARAADRAIKNMTKRNTLLSGKKDQILRELIAAGVRFPNNKAKFIVEAKKLFTKKGKIHIKNKLGKGSVNSKREWLVKNVKGMNYKEAGHFLRNVGLGSELAILDRHILKNLLEHGIIDEIPKTLSKKQYLLIEEKMRKFSKQIKIPMAELDLLFWSEETGEVFK